MQELEILIATHKPYSFPKEHCYFPIHVGKSLTHLELGGLTDNSGENISKKNRTFCELTAIYWAWKNQFFKAKYVGLVHYRRYFKGKKNYIATQDELLPVLENVDCLVPQKRNYYIETIYSHYKNAHHIRDLEITKKIIQEIYPNYLQAFDKVMKGKTLYLYNMFVMKKECFEQYCHWLFTILFQLEERIDIQHYDAYQQRVFGFIAERLLNVWLEHHQLKIAEMKVINTEGENLFKKGVSFLKRKWFSSNA